LLQMLAIFLIPAALCLAFGRMVGDRRQGWAVLAAMSLMFVAAVLVITRRAGRQPAAGRAGRGPGAARCRPAATWKARRRASASTPARCSRSSPPPASCGAVNAMHDSLTPGGMVPLVLMQLGEVVFGGVGSGLYGMLVFAMLAVFIAGLMIGRTPEYLGKKIEAYEMKMSSIAILVTPIAGAGGHGGGGAGEAGRAGMANPGAHGFSRSSTPSPRPPTTTAAPLPACRPTRPSTT
jgi:K+-transporting ATPase ATPase A chain